MHVVSTQQSATRIGGRVLLCSSPIIIVHRQNALHNVPDFIVQKSTEITNKKAWLTQRYMRATVLVLYASQKCEVEQNYDKIQTYSR